MNGTKTASWTYDSSQQVMAYHDRESKQKHTYSYDITGRLLEAKVQDTTITSTTQDSLLFSALYSYDDLNRLEKTRIYAGGRSPYASYSYNKNGQSEKAQFSTGRNLSYNYDNLGRLLGKTVSTEAPLEYDYYYWTSEREPDGETEYRTTLLRNELLGDTGYRYHYDVMGNIVKIEEGKRQAGTQNSLTGRKDMITYVYDSQNQLIRENNLYLKQTIVYTYDNGGNIKSKTFYEYTTEDDLSGHTSTKTVTYTYNDVWKDQLISYDGKAIQYDEIGNPITYQGKTLEWTGRRLDSLTENEKAISYIYNADGLRTKKTVGNNTTEYYYSNGQLSYEKRSDCELYYIYDAEGQLAVINYVKNGTSNSYYVMVNSRGDVEALYTGQGELRVQYRYDSWGNVISVLDGEGEEISSASHIGNVNPFRYRGYYYDVETGFYYVSSRYYDPEIGRFISADTTDVLGVQDNFDDLNLYAYCNNNPVNYTDPDGTLAIEIGYVVLTVLVVSYAYVGGVRRTIKTTKTYKVSKPYWNSHSHNKYKGYAIISFSVFTTTNVVKKGVSYYSEHKSTKKGKKRNKHEEGNARRMRDQGGEKKKKKPGWKRPR